MKKDKKFLEDLESFLGKSKHKDEIIAKYDALIKQEKADGKRIKCILKDIGDPEEVAKNELKACKSNSFSDFINEVKEKFASLKNKKDKTDKDKKEGLLSRVKSNISSLKINKDKKEKVPFKQKISNIKSFLTKDLSLKKKRNVTDDVKEIIEEVKEEVEDKISDVSEIVSESHVFESKKARRKRIILRILGIILTSLFVFIWLWITVVFFASVFAFFDGVKFIGIILALFGLDFLVLWLSIMVNKTVLKKKMSLKLNLIVIFSSVFIIAFGLVLTIIKINKIDYVHDVNDKYSLTRKLETYDLPREDDGKFIITFNSNYDTQYIIEHDKNISGKVKIDTRYYECYYDYYAKPSVNGTYISLKLDNRDRFSVYLDDIKEGKIYDNDELSRYIVKISVNPNEASKLIIQ